MKKLNQDDFRMKIVKDLGVNFVGSGTVRRRRAIFACNSCGKHIEASVSNVKGKAQYGCNSCAVRKRVTTHGQSGTKLYQVWKNMKRRCSSPGATSYKDYGGRGITVCDEWFSDFLLFKQWADQCGYDGKLTIERKDNNSGYNPENCRLANRIEQANNRRNSKKVTVGNITDTIGNWARFLDVPYSLITGRIRIGWTDEEAIMGRL